MNRRGAALVLVIGLSATLLAASAVVAAAVTRSKLRARTSADLLSAIEVSEAAGVPILRWLREESSGVVLEPSNASPSIEVLDDAISVLGTTVRIRVRAFDQCGMIPNTWSDGRASPILRSAFVGRDGLSGFWSGGRPALDTFGDGRAFRVRTPEGVSISESHATHNPYPSLGPRGEPGAVVINVNTATGYVMSELERVIGDRVPPGVRENREEGERTMISRVYRTPLGDVRLSGRSLAWAFRTEVTFGSGRFATWSVYTQRDGRWGLEQRYAITR